MISHAIVGYQQASSSSFDLEVRVLNEADHVAEGIRDGRHLDVAAHFPHGIPRAGPPGKRTLPGLFDICYAPVRHGVVPGRHAAHVRMESKLEPADLESHVERFVEVRSHAEAGGVPY